MNKPNFKIPVAETGKKIGSGFLIFAANGGGLIGGSFLMQLLPKFGPAWLQKLVPGLIGILVGTFVAARFENRYVQALSLGLGMAGVLDIVKKNLTGVIPDAITNAIPTLSGVGRAGYVQNYGEYPPSYFQKNVQGLGNAAYALQGMGNTAYALQGLSNTAYALQGFGAMLLQQ